MPSVTSSDFFVKLHAITDVGRVRSHNEDNFVACPDLREKLWYLTDEPSKLSKHGSVMVVADGMGGTNAGEVASKIAVDTIQSKFDALELEDELNELQVQEILHQAILEAHQAIVESSLQNQEYSGMGTTIIIGWVFPGKAHFGWSGDSRAYLYRENEGLSLLSKDHSLVWEMVEAGEITPDEADVHPRSNIITQSLGDLRQTPKPDFAVCNLEPGDRLLLCSDGLNNMINHKGIEGILGAKVPLAKATQGLVKAANHNGGVDNVTVLSLEVLKNPSSPENKNSRKGFWFLSLVALGFFFLWWLMGISGGGNTTPLKQNQKVVVPPLEENVETPTIEEGTSGLNTELGEGELKDESSF